MLLKNAITSITPIGSQTYYAIGCCDEVLDWYRIALEYLPVYQNRKERIARCSSRIKELESGHEFTTHLT